MFTQKRLTWYISSHAACKTSYTSYDLMLFYHFSITMRSRKGRGKDYILKSLLWSSVNTFILEIHSSDSSQDMWHPHNKRVYVPFCLWACAHLHLGTGRLNWVDCCNEDYKAKSWLWLGSKIWLGQANLSKVLYCPPHPVVLSFIWDFFSVSQNRIQLDASRPRPIIMK